MRKPAITGIARPQGWDDVVKPIAKGAAKKVKQPVKKAVKKAAAAKSKARYDIPDPAYKGKVYGKGGSMTKAYKDYVLRNMDADF